MDTRSHTDHDAESSPPRPAWWTWWGVGLLLAILMVAWSLPRLKPPYLFPLVIGGIVGAVLGFAARQLHLPRRWFIIFGAAVWAVSITGLAITLAAVQHTRRASSESVLAREIIAAVEQAEAEATQRLVHPQLPPWVKALAARYPTLPLWTGLGLEAMLAIVAASLVALPTSRQSLRQNSSP